MSGIFGIIHLDGSPVPEHEIETMRSAMSEWGPDGSNVWVKDSAGLGSMLLFNTPEAVHEKLPLQSSQGFVLTAEARLDNRDELFLLLGISGHENRSMPDGEIILRAYEKWRENTPDHLLGDWSFAVWHPQEKKLFIARDHAGNTGLYYYRDQHRFAFASSRKALLALGIPRHLNEFYLACLLVTWPAHHGPGTIELDIHRLPPSHSLTLQGNDLKIERYWRLEDVPLLRLKNTDEYIEGFLSVYDRAISDRMRSHRPVGVTLSGGLDSGSITALMARALQEENKRLKAYTSVPVHDVTGTMDEEDRFGDELPFAMSTADHAGNVDLIQITARHLTPIQGIRRALEIHREPGHAAGNMYWIYDMLALAQKDGLGVLLTGQGGNATVSWPGRKAFKNVPASLKKREWRKALQMLAYPMLPLPLHRSFYRSFRRDGINWENTSIHPDFTRRINLTSRYIQSIGKVTTPQMWQSANLIRYSVIKPGASFLGSIWAENSAAYHMEMRDPTMDKRVLEFTLAIPDSEFTGPDGTDRWIMRAAMQGLLPDDVRLNRRRGGQASDLAQRLLDSAPEVESTLTELGASDLAQQYLSLKRMREVWEDIQKKIDRHNTHRAISILTRGIMAGLYLTDLEKTG